MRLLLVPHFKPFSFFLAVAINSTNEANRQAECATKQSILLRCLWVSYSALFTFLVRWLISTISLPPGDVILAWLACHLNDVIFCLHLE